MRKYIDIVEKAVKSAPVNTDSPAFKNWFGASKVVDRDGQPLRVFHGGAAGITAFDKSTIGKNFGVDEEGFFFTTNTSYSTAWYGGNDHRVYDDMYSAGAYAKNAEGGVYPCYLRMENPLMIADWADWHGLNLDDEVADYGHVQDVLDRNKKSIIATAREDGNDGVIASHGNDHVFVVFEPNQIKSIFNTTFSRDSDHISEEDDESRYPMHVTNAELVAMGREDDDPEYHAGDTQVYFGGRGATLKTIPLDNLEHGNPVDDDVVDIYAGKTTQAPPIIVDGTTVEDGNHRLAAARARGDTEILAYVLDA